MLIAYFTMTATTPALYIRSCEAATDRRPRSRDQAEAGDIGDHTD